MTTRIAFVLFALILAAILLDVYVLQTGIALELARRGAGLLQTLAFWR